MIAALPEFLPRFFAGVALNFEIALLSLLLGLVLGAPLVMLLMSGRAASLAAGSVVAMLRAAPTFVVMFFLLNVLPRDFTVLGLRFQLSPLTSVVLAQAIYAIAYVADNGSVALRALRQGDAATAVLFLPNLARAFFVLVMSSSAGAAIGVPEGIAVILREAELMPTLGDKMVLFAIGILCFGVTLQAGFALMRLLQRHLGRLALRTR